MTTDTIPGLSSPVPTDLLIGGKWVAASDGARFDVTDPADGTTLCTVAAATAADVTAAIDAAYAALPELAAMPPRQRAEILRTAFEVMTERVEDIALLMVCENGKALPDAKAEATYAAEFPLVRRGSRTHRRQLHDRASGGPTRSWCPVSRSASHC